jgi:hypothetical protein
MTPSHRMDNPMTPRETTLEQALRERAERAEAVAADLMDPEDRARKRGEAWAYRQAASLMSSTPSPTPPAEALQELVDDAQELGIYDSPAGAGEPTQEPSK